MAGRGDATIRIEDFHAFESADLFRRTLALAVAEIRTQAEGWRRIGAALAAERELLARALAAIDRTEFRGRMPASALAAHLRLDDRLTALIDGLAAPAAALDDLAAGVEQAAVQVAGAHVGYRELIVVAGGFESGNVPHPAPFLEASYRPVALAAAAPPPLPGLERPHAPVDTVTATSGPAPVTGPGPGASGPVGGDGLATTTAATAAPPTPSAPLPGAAGAAGPVPGAAAAAGTVHGSTPAISPAAARTAGEIAGPGAPGGRGGTGTASSPGTSGTGTAGLRPGSARRADTGLGTGRGGAAGTGGSARGSAGYVGGPRSPGGTAGTGGAAGAGAGARPPGTGPAPGTGGSSAAGAGRAAAGDPGPQGMRRGPGGGAIMPMGGARGFHRGGDDGEEAPAEYLTSADNGEQIVGQLARVVFPVLGRRPGSD